MRPVRFSFRRAVRTRPYLRQGDLPGCEVSRLLADLNPSGLAIQADLNPYNSMLR